MATGFQTSLQDTINWLTQAEQTLNMAQPPSLILDTVLFQIDEHKVATLKILIFMSLTFQILFVSRYCHKHAVCVACNSFHPLCLSRSLSMR